MKDVYFMNKETGEILPSSVAIKDFYKTHGILESWTDLWEETNMETETEMASPDFSNIF